MTGRRIESRRGREPLHAPDRRRSRRALARPADGRVAPASPSRCRTPCVVAIKEREPVLVWEVGDAPLPRRRATATLFARLDARRRRRPARPAGRRRSPGVVGRPSRRGAARPGRPRRRDPARLARARPTSAARAAALGRRVTDENGFIVRARPAGWTRRLRLLHADPADDRTDPRPGPPAAQPARTAASRPSPGSSSLRRPTARTSPGRPRRPTPAARDVAHVAVARAGSPHG